MGIRAIAAVAMLAGAGFVVPLPAHGQITSYVDEYGKRVYINAAGRRMVPKAGPSVARLPLRRTTFVADLTPRNELVRLATEVAERHQVDPRLVHAVIEAESGWNPVAVSNKGAEGLMQLVPATAERFGVGNVFDPAQNVDAGVRYLGQLLQRYQGDLIKSVAAYHAGESAVDRAGGIPNYPHTRAYVRKVTDTYFGPDSNGSRANANAPRRIYRIVDERGRVIYTNE